MADDQLTDAQRESLRYYLATETDDISVWFSMRFYWYRIARWGFRFLIVALALKLLVPPDVSVSLRFGMIAMLGFIFVLMIVRLVHCSIASVEHWRLLRRVLNWDAVRELHDASSAESAVTDQQESH